MGQVSFWIKRHLLSSFIACTQLAPKMMTAHGDKRGFLGGKENDTDCKFPPSHLAKMRGRAEVRSRWSVAVFLMGFYSTLWPGSWIGWMFVRHCFQGCHYRDSLACVWWHQLMTADKLRVWYSILVHSGCGLIRAVVVVISLPRRILDRWLKLFWGSNFLRYSGHLPSGSLGSSFFLSVSRTSEMLLFFLLTRFSDFSFVLSLMIALNNFSNWLRIERGCCNLVYDTVFWFRYLFSSGCGLMRAVVVVTSLPEAFGVLSFFLFLSCSCSFLSFL